MIRVVLFDWGNVLRSKTSWRRQREIYSLVNELRGRGIKTGILSNNYRLGAIIVRLLGDLRGFDPVILSCYEGFRKPEKQIFEIAIKRTGYRPSEIIFVDNVNENIDAAKKAGLKTILVKNTSQTINDIKTAITKQNKN